MSRAALLPGLGFAAALLLAASAAAADPGRYQISPGEPRILLDTQTGKSWRYEDETWVPIEIDIPEPPPQPKAKISTQERWRRDAEERRLKLKPSGAAEAPKKTPLKSLLK
ncbi:MAG: hypothetical protein OXR84_13510 [Magnetovibrio sp.]|nr:hypothetical protein [Magnetovibrio sp.]